MAAAAAMTAVLAAGCGGSSSAGGAGSTGAAGPAASSPAASSTPASGGGAGSQAGSKTCTGGLTGSEPGVVQVFCNGTASIHVKVATIAKDFAGGQCESTGDLWSVTAGVITQAGTYHGPPVDVVSVNKNSSGGGTIQLQLSGRTYFVDGATLTLSNGAKTAHLQGKTTAESDAPGTAVTVDVAC